MERISFLSFLGNKEKIKKKKRILVLYSDTGGGHRSPAEAIRSGFQDLYKDKYDVDIVDLWTDHFPYPVCAMPHAYTFLVRYPWMYWTLYYVLNPRWLHRPFFHILSFFCYARVNEAFELYKPDLVVSVHPLLQHIPLKVLQQRIQAGVQRQIAFATVVVDLSSCHNTWYHRGVTQCFVPSKHAYKVGRMHGLRHDQLTLHGMPVRPEFAKTLACKAALRKKLNMLPDVPAVLLMGGAEGMGSMEDTLLAIEKNLGASSQVVVICGRNKDLAQRLSHRSYPEGMNVMVKVFVTNMNEWMSACDAIVTKAGSSTIAEALVCGTPILLNYHIPGQEFGNVSYVRDNRVGVYERKPERTAKVLNEWFLRKKDELKQMSIKAKSLLRPDVLSLIVRDLAALCEQTVFTPNYSGQAQPTLV